MPRFAEARMFLISGFPRPRVAIGVWVQTQGHDESKARAEGVSGKYVKRGNENDVLSSLPNVEK